MHKTKGIQMIWNLWLIVFEKTTWRSFVWVIYTVFADEMGRYEKQQEHTHNSKKNIMIIHD